PTAGKATFIKSGRWVMVAPTNNPPFDPPRMANFSDEVYLFSIKYSAAAIKSSNTFCFCILVPALCHFLPYSPPPRKFGRSEEHTSELQSRENLVCRLL